LRELNQDRETPGVGCRFNRRFWITCATVGLLALAARLIYLFIQGPSIAPDSYDYLGHAKGLLERHVFSRDATPWMLPSIRRPPLYPAFLAALGATSTQHAGLPALVQIVLDVLVTIAVLAGARLVSSLPVAAVAAGVYALHPGAVPNSATIMSEGLFATLLVACVACLLVACQISRPWISAIGGLFLGAAVLCRAVALPLPFLLPLCLLGFPEIRHRWKHAALLSLAAVIVVLPWSIRCTLVSGEPVLVQGTSGVNVYIPSRTDWNQLDQTEIWHKFDREPEVQAQGITMLSLSRSNTPREIAQADRALRHHALRRIGAEPLTYLQSRIRVLPFLAISSWLPPIPTGASGVTRSAWRVARPTSLFLFSVLPMAFALVGVMRPRLTLAGLVCSSLWIYTLCVHLPLWIEPRFWLPMIPFQLVSAAAGIDLIQRRLVGRNAAVPG